MATEIYSSGVHRVFYQSVAFAESLTVTAYVWNPDLEQSDLQTFTELAEGFYYIDYNFSVPGVYVMLIYENGAKTKSNTFRVYNYPGMIRYRREE